MHIMSVATQSVSRPRRRVHSAAFKRKLVELSLVPGASVAGIALEHGINANLLFGWRRAHMKSQSDGTTQPILLPVELVSPGTPMATAPALTSRGNSAPGTIEIELAGARVRVRGAVDEASLRNVLAALRA